MPIGTNDNSRYYRNRLYENKDVDTLDNIVSTTSTSSLGNQNSVISSETVKTAAIDALRKKVIKRLIDISSPTNHKKQKLFQQLVKNEDNTRIIIEMSVEMGSSVDDTKMMLMNNCV